MTEQIRNADERAQMYLALLAKGLSYGDVAESCGETSSEAVRNVVRRYNKKHFGNYSGFSTMSVQPELDETELTEKKIPFPPKNPQISLDAEVWTIDIERFPRIVYEWQASRKYSSFTPESMVIQEGRMVSFAAKRLGDGQVYFSSEYHHGREKMLQTLWNIMDRAQIINSYNGSRFDIPHINGEFRDSNFPVPSPYKQIDLMSTVKRKFNYDHNRLKDIQKRWNLAQEKMENEGFDLWKRCMAGDPEAWEIMKQYNMQDVRGTEVALLQNYQWLTGSIPNLGLWSGRDMVCPACGSDEVNPDGAAATGVTLYVAYRCDNCGYRSRSNEKVNTTILRPVTW